MAKKSIKKKRKNVKSSRARSAHPREVSHEKLQSILAKTREFLNEEDAEILEGAIDTLSVVTNELEHKRVSVARLKKLLFGDTTEKLSNVFPETKPDSPDKDATDEEKKSDTSFEKTDASKKKKRKGHGRNGTEKYTGAEKQIHRHDSLQHKGPCPEEGCDGKLYLQKAPKRLVRVTGMAPLKATVHELERLRCNLCGKIFTAKAPDNVGNETYDTRARAMIAMLKYGCGTPFYRLEQLENNLGIPLPSSTQWDEVHRLASPMMPVYTELICHTANGEVLHNDDTVARILELESPPKIGKNGKERTGVFTSGIVGISDNRKIAMFFTGRNHAGDNLEDVLAHRRKELSPPIQMSDGLNTNTSGDFKTIEANCNCHARRKYVEVANDFPAETRHILNVYKDVYQNDKTTHVMTETARLAYHQEHSKPLLDNLHDWFHDQIEENKNIEPNCALGVAINYMRDHWEKLTLFLRIPGAPLDNNICERAIKKAILHRKNALFFKTENGAHVADIFMTIIHTCELNKVNPFEYIVAVAENETAVTASPQNWLPWNYLLNIEK